MASVTMLYHRQSFQINASYQSQILATSPPHSDSWGAERCGRGCGGGVEGVIETLSSPTWGWGGWVTSVLVSFYGSVTCQLQC